MCKPSLLKGFVVKLDTFADANPAAPGITDGTNASKRGIFMHKKAAYNKVGDIFLKVEIVELENVGKSETM